jgi:Type IV secretion system pilin
MKRLIASLVLALVCLVSAFPMAVQAAGVFDNTCGTGGGGGSTLCDSQSSKNPLTGSSGLLINVTHIIAFVAGAAAVIVIIVSGIRMITSQGEADKFSGARASLINAFIGLVVVILAQAIVSYAIGKLIH